MYKKIICLVAWVLLLQSFPTFAQSSVNGATILKNEQDQFLRQLKNSPVDSATAYNMAGYVESEITNVRQIIASDATLTAIDKEKASRSLVYFIQALKSCLEKQSVDLYDIPAAFKSYKAVLTTLLKHQPLNEVLIPLQSGCSKLLPIAFSQYSEYALLDDIAVYKRLKATPEFILQFLETKPGFRFADSLLLEAAAHDPWKLVYYLNGNRQGIQNTIRKTDNIYLEQIVTLSANKNASELLPFIKQIAEKKITPEEIIEKRTDIVSYFQLLVNTLRDSRKTGNPSCIFLEPLRNGIRQRSISFFVNGINELHNATDAVRFASVKNLRPEDLYYTITSCGEELYTSSYLGLYKRLMEHFKNQSADSLFDIVAYDNLRIFMRLAANYNVLPDFLRTMSREKRGELLKRFIAGIENDKTAGLEIAMDIADSFTALASDSEISTLVESELQFNLKRCTAAHQYPGMRLYGILLNVFGLVRKEGGMNTLWEMLGNYEVLKRDELENKNGEIVQLVLFYGDEDGVSSFNNFLKQYTDPTKWEIAKNTNWVSIRSLTDHPVIIYANMPLDCKQEMDLKAQDSLISFLQERSLEPSVLIHRGHSYHLEKTLQRLQPSVKLAILGSCGGYNKALSIATINPDVQVIGSKKTGAMSVNDPIIEMINETLVNNKDISWPEIWNRLGARFENDKQALGLFNEYFPPSKNLSLFIVKLFTFSKRFA
jgi:hypothetical protein